jgi:hypothetical protein
VQQPNHATFLKFHPRCYSVTFIVNMEQELKKIAKLLGSYAECMEELKVRNSNLVKNYDAVKTENASLKSELELLRNNHDQLLTKFEQVEAKYENLIEKIKRKKKQADSVETFRSSDAETTQEGEALPATLAITGFGLPYSESNQSPVSQRTQGSSIIEQLPTSPFIDNMDKKPVTEILSSSANLEDTRKENIPITEKGNSSDTKTRKRLIEHVQLKNGDKFKYQETSRKKSDRAKMHATDCPCCRDYYRVTAGLNRPNNIQQTSKHRSAYPKSHTPAGFWDIGIENNVRVYVPPSKPNVKPK